MRGVNIRLLIHDDEQRKRGREHFTTVFNRVICGEVRSLLVDEMSIQTTSPNKREDLDH